LNTVELPIQNATSQLSRRESTPFLMVAFVWLAVGAALCARFQHPGLSLALGWLAVLWGLCLFDLYALSRAVGALLGLASVEGEKRGALIIQASYWGMIKLACLGILGAILLRGHSIPALGLLMGTGTLVVVPLLGGYWWSQKVLRHA
jgi:hypothetical protein